MGIWRQSVPHWTHRGRRKICRASTIKKNIILSMHLYIQPTHGQFIGPINSSLLPFIVYRVSFLLFEANKTFYYIIFFVCLLGLPVNVSHSLAFVSRCLSSHFFRSLSSSAHNSSRVWFRRLFQPQHFTWTVFFLSNRREREGKWKHGIVNPVQARVSINLRRTVRNQQT